MSDAEADLRAALTIAEEKLSVQTSQQTKSLRLLSDQEKQLTAVRAELLQVLQTQKEADGKISVNEALLQTRDLELAETAAHLAVSEQESSRLTEKLLEANSFLAKKSEELERANAELLGMIQQKEDFVAALTHDLKSPLVGSNKMLEFLVAGQIPAQEQGAICRQLLESNKSMLLMVQNLLGSYRCDSGSIVPVNEPVEIPKLLSECLDEFSFSIKEKKIELCCRVDELLPVVMTDRTLLKRVLVNLLDNALKFTPDGGQISIEATVGVRGGQVSVRNTGVGMAPEAAARIFERFWQTEQGRKHGIGTGLGLYFSKQIMQLLGGDIECDSSEHVHTKFTILLKDAKRGI